MLHPTVPLTPKDSDGPLRVLVIGRISTEHQNEENIDASFRYVEQYLTRAYSGPLETKHLGERASGMLADRSTIREAEDLIATGDWDLVIAEDLSRIFRNPRHQYNFVQDAVDAGTRVICIGDNLDTADENWEIMMGAATLRHGTAIPDIRRRVRRTATHAFHSGGMVQKVKYGYRKLTSEEADTGNHGPGGLRVAKRPECTPIIREMRDRVLRGEFFQAIADWLRRERVETPPYAQRWTGRLVKDLLCDPILSGTRRFRMTVYQPVYRTGKHRRVSSATPETERYPQLAHLTPEEHRELLAVIHERTAAQRRKRKTDSKRSRVRVPRSRTLWPGQSACCAVCGALMYYSGTYLKCRNALPRSGNPCWNHVQVPAELARQQLVSWLLECFGAQRAFRETLAATAVQEFTRITQRGRFTADATRRLQSLKRQAANLAEAIAQGGGELTVLLAKLKSVEQEVRVLERQLKADKRHEARPSLKQAEIDSHLEGLLLDVAGASFDFTDLMRRIFTEFVIHPVQDIKTGQIRPRGKLKLSLTPLTGSDESPDSEAQVPVVLDLFDPPLHVKHLKTCVEATRQHPEWSLKRIAKELGINHMTVKRAFDYSRMMEERGLTDPYREVHEPPDNASRWKPQSAS